ncbi:MAG: nicotinamide riboside transporter PnuC [Prevotellaceae bacterium]|jgi:nicotinamide mononucleotide transporter|nr:nicotinamide riboside transporter PnuC [Prevotellaceae bacterium]
MMEELVSFFSVDHVLLRVDGREVSVPEALATLFGLTCVFLAMRARVLNFWVGYLYNVLLFALFLQKGLYSSMLVQPVSLAINAFGHYRWTHPHKEEENRKHQLKITVLTVPQRANILLILVALTVAWGFVMSQLGTWMPWVFRPAQLPYIDALVMMSILTAQLLAAQKKLDTWGVWTIVNITNITLYLLRGLVFMPFVSAAYMIMAVFGFKIWYEKYKKETLGDE